MSGLGLQGVSVTTLLMSDFTFSPQPSPLLRQQYLGSLRESQEWFLEALVEVGEVWTHDDGSYGVTHENTLVEFFSADPGLSQKRLYAFWEQRGFSTALVKSFDDGLVRSCEGLGWTATVGGFLFRTRKKHHHAAFERAEMHAATPADIHMLWQINDGFFDSKDEVTDLVGSNKLWTVRVDREIAGCGVSNRVIADGDAVDVGMMVAPSLRRRGLGTYIISEIADRVEQEGLRPICGCGAGNVASRATLENAGFVCDHQLLSFSP